MRAALEVADVFRAGEAEFLARYGQQTSHEQYRVLRAVKQCRTAALGGHVQLCQGCGHQQIQYNSCRNRHCPKCQGMARARWLDQREAELLPVPYFHLVFTLPHEPGPLALQNRRVVYGLLFQAAAETVQQLAADPKHLGARVGCLMVLHTWGQNLMHHPHVHAVVTGGGLSADGTRWVSCRRPGRRDFFSPCVCSVVSFAADFSLASDRLLSRAGYVFMVLSGHWLSVPALHQFDRLLSTAPVLSPQPQGSTDDELREADRRRCEVDGHVREEDARRQSLTGTGEERCSASAAEVESQATPAANDECRVPAAGPGSSGLEPVVRAVSAATDRTGSGSTGHQHTELTHQAGSVPGAQRPGQLRLLGTAFGQQTESPGTGALRMDHAARQCLPARSTRHWENASVDRTWPGRLP
ncbi:hypothetical protein GC176_15725 [bacterium]|nr:hypothetical protein [bacterium]